MFRCRKSTLWFRFYSLGEMKEEHFRIAVIQLKLRDKEYICEKVDDESINLRVREKVKYKYKKRRKKCLKVMLIKEENRNDITIINVYAPTPEIARKDQKEMENLYGEFRKVN